MKIPKAKKFRDGRSKAGRPTGSCLGRAPGPRRESSADSEKKAGRLGCVLAGIVALAAILFTAK